MYVIIFQLGDAKTCCQYGTFCLGTFDREEDAVRYCEIEFPEFVKVSDVRNCWKNRASGDEVWVEFARYHSKESAAEMFHTCDECGKTIIRGYTHEDSAWCCCEECMESLIMGNQMRYTPDLDDEVNEGMNEADGYYDEYIDGEWVPSAIYWTDWS